MKHTLGALVFSALTLAWLILALILSFIISHYDFVHIHFLPLQPQFIELPRQIASSGYWLDLIKSAIGAAVFSGACISLGFAVLGNWQKLGADYLAIGASAFLIGQILLSVVLLTCIVLYTLTPRIVAIILAMALLSGVRYIPGYLRAWPGVHLPAEFRRTDRFVLAIALAVFTLTALYSSAILGYDSVVQYFSQPKILAVTQTAVLTYPQDPFLISSLHTEILYTALMQISGDQSARLLPWINGLVIILLGLAIGKEAGLSGKARLWFLVLMLTSTAFVDILGDGKVELVSTAPLLAGVYWILKSFKQPRGEVFALVGFLLGFAIIARPYNIFLVPLFAVTLYASHLVTQNRNSDFDFGKFVRMAGWMLVPLLAMGAFHLLQNWLWLGNPVAMIAARTAVSEGTWQWQFDPRLLNVYRLLYPFVVSFANSPQSLGNVSAFFVGFLPFLLMKRIRRTLQERPALLRLGLAATVTHALWLGFFFTVVEIRYILFLWVVFFLVIGQVIDRTAEQFKLPVGILLGPLAVLALAYMGARTVLIASDTYSPVDSSGQAHCRGLAFCTFLDSLNEAAAPGERVFVLNAYRYYLRPDLFECASQSQEYYSLQTLAQEGSPRFWTEVYQAGFRYVTYEDNFASFHARFGTLPGTQGVPSWLQISVLASSPDNLEKIYRLVATGAAVPQAMSCQRNAAGVWQVGSVSPPAQ